MILEKYLTKYRIGVTEFAKRCDRNPSLIWHYLSGRRKPNQTTAEVIEKESDGLVTVFEQRGKDDRETERDIDEDL